MQGCCQNPYSQCGSVVELCHQNLISSYYRKLTKSFVMEPIDRIDCSHNVWFHIFSRNFNIYKKCMHNHLQHIKFMSHVGCTTDNITHTEVLIIKTNSFHMMITQRIILLRRKVLSNYQNKLYHTLKNYITNWLIVPRCQNTFSWNHAKHNEE